MHHQCYMRRPSVTGLILAASDISGPTVLGDLPESVAKIMALDDPVTAVQATNEVMFHLAAQVKDSLRRDTATYQWFGKTARAVVKNPFAVLPGKNKRTYQLIGKVEPPSNRYSELEYLRLVLKYVPRNQSSSGLPEIWLQTMVAHSYSTIAPYLRKSITVSTL